MTMSPKYGFRWEFVDMPDTSHPSFALVLKTMTSEFGPVSTRWVFDVVERFKGFPTVRIGVTTPDDHETMMSHVHLGTLP